jgi:1,4-alpha-glucan branching enzyme
MMLDAHAIRAVVEGEHGDPFAVLGPHREQTSDGAAVAVRAIVPGAATVRVLPADAPPTLMERLHPAGFFETVLPDRIGRDAFGARQSPWKTSMSVCLLP